MKKIIHVSDLTGNDIKDTDDLVHVHIQRHGYGIKLGNTTYHGNTVFDVHLSELSDLFENIEFVKDIQPDAKLRMMSSNPVNPDHEFAKASFHIPDGGK